ncbi:hypothetical protein QCA50_013975 [Cerrena zonata]|uniref:Uncharacterized protein n=1 Tax=Cerrena zonata TaxID=2478898 RepID=A0AAW0FS85_9APHY
MLQNQGQLQQQQQPQPRSVQPQPSRYYSDPSSPLANKNLDIQRNFHDGLDKPPPRKSQVVSSDQSPSSAYLAPENDDLSMDHDTPMEKPNNFSQASVYSTSAQVDGDEGKKYAVDITQFSDSVPPVSLKEKIDMIDTDNVTPKENAKKTLNNQNPSVENEKKFTPSTSEPDFAIFDLPDPQPS